MKLGSFKFLLLVLLMVATSLTARPQQSSFTVASIKSQSSFTVASTKPQKSSFTVASIKPYDKAVPGQVMEVLIEGLSSGATRW